MALKGCGVALSLLAFMFFLMFVSAWNDSAIMDELAHIPAGYSYVAKQDMRLNPEHPPLIKDLAGLPLLFLNLNFPTEVRPWKDDINGQWDMGQVFLYRSGNDPDKILHWSRFPMMLLAVLFGLLLFLWTKQRFGTGAAHLSLFFFAFSPTFLAHSRYVTTDLAAAFGFFIGIAAFINFIENPNRKNILIAGIAFGIAQLLKFSLFLLVPICGVLAVVWILVGREYAPAVAGSARFKHMLSCSAELLGKIILIGFIGIALVWVVYEFHVWNYPQEKQLADATQILNSFGKRWLVDIDIWLINHDATRGLGQYMLGLLMVVQRAAGGNTTYFLGEISNSGWWYYFPVAYLLKETLALHILTLFVCLAALKRWVAAPSLRAREWIREHFAETAMLFFIAFYWIYSMRSPLNIGVRHVLPTFPFIYILVSKHLTDWLHHVPAPNPKTTREWISQAYRLYIASMPKNIIAVALIFWVGFSSVAAFPAYLSYYNELVGSDYGYLYIVDSNYDWGQDLKRLRDYTEANGIETIALEYFGGGSPEYYLGSKFVPWSSKRGPVSGYFAISATLREGAFGKPGPYFTSQRPEDSYPWLRGYEPIARAGKSIFIYKLP